MIRFDFFTLGSNDKTIVLIFRLQLSYFVIEHTYPSTVKPALHVAGQDVLLCQTINNTKGHHGVV